MGEIVVDGLPFLRALLWHDGRLHACWGAPPNTTVGVVGMDGRVEVVAEFEGAGQALAGLSDGSLLALRWSAPQLLRIHGGKVRPYARWPEAEDLQEVDVAVDARGRAWVVTWDGYDFEEIRTHTPMFRVDPDGTVTEARTFKWANAVDVTDQGRTLVVLGRPFLSRLTQFDVSGPDPPKKRRQGFARIGEGRFPTAMCMEGDDAVWLAGYTEVFKLARRGGVAQRIEPGGWCRSLAVGGESGRTLFMAVDGRIERFDD